MQIVVVTGMSGAGRSTALHALEDLGFYCVDNLPPSLAPELIALAAGEASVERVGLGVDVRNGAFLAGTEGVIEALREGGHSVEVLFFDAADPVLVRRYSESRRPHPLAPDGDLLEAIRAERERLSLLREEASHVIDTTRYSVHDLKREVVAHVASDGRRMVVRIVSFGFKYGLPVDADLVFDLRYLPNPYFVDELRPKTGQDADVASYVLEREEAQELLDDVGRFFNHTLPRYEREGKAYLTVAIGCTGGRHRSVAVAEELHKRFAEAGYTLHLEHRDVGRKVYPPKK
ncbi:MAG: RNase adapter RapZ [Myxococcota bacterium]